MKDIALHIHKGIYHKSDKANAPENRSDSWRNGYAVGSKKDCDSSKEIRKEFERIGAPYELTDSFKEWKRGMWAAIIQRATAAFSAQKKGGS